MPNTTNLSLPYPQASDTVDVPRDIAALANALDTKAIKISAAASPPASPVEGMLWYQTDTDLLLVYNGSAWTSIAGGNTAGNSGLVHIATTTVSAQTTIQLSSCFSASYDAYEVMLTTTAFSGNPNLYWQLMKAGTPTAANYYWGSHGVGNGGSTSISNGSPGTSVNPAYCNTAIPQGYFKITLLDPFNTRNTTYSFTDNHNDTAAQWIRTGGGNHLDATSHDGIRFTVSTGTMSGTLAVYGYRR